MTEYRTALLRTAGSGAEWRDPGCEIWVVRALLGVDDLAARAQVLHHRLEHVMGGLVDVTGELLRIDGAGVLRQPYEGLGHRVADGVVDVARRNLREDVLQLPSHGGEDRALEQRLSGIIDIAARQGGLDPLFPGRLFDPHVRLCRSMTRGLSGPRRGPRSAPLTWTNSPRRSAASRFATRNRGRIPPPVKRDAGIRDKASRNVRPVGLGRRPVLPVREIRRNTAPAQ